MAGVPRFDFDLLARQFGLLAPKVDNLDRYRAAVFPRRREWGFLHAFRISRACLWEPIAATLAQWLQALPGASTEKPAFHQ
jgi:hypothetical protein